MAEPDQWHKMYLEQLSEKNLRIAELEAFVRKVSELQPGDAGSALKYEALDLLQKSTQE